MTGSSSSEADESSVETPLLRVVAGDPTPEELAALVAVVAASASGGTPDAPAPRSEWSARHRLVRGPHRHGPGAWRASAR
ncbi:acyl-CoA carboxylase subunit epsilon [Nocardioides aurantiacus]|uniref:acyl-CoA carboxylase subunit epsilon n=1 Tax=Nocardioides aurantiacus TaxID=86796 RepID=UPI00403F50D5